MIVFVVVVVLAVVLIVTAIVVGGARAPPGRSRVTRRAHHGNRAKERSPQQKLNVPIQLQ